MAQVDLKVQPPAADQDISLNEVVITVDGTEYQSGDVGSQQLLLSVVRGPQEVAEAVGHILLAQGRLVPLRRSA